MTARDEAIVAMAEAFIAKVKQHPVPPSDPFGGELGNFFGCSTDDAMEVALDAIPTDVLARLAIERGALIEAGVYDPSDYTVRSTVYYEDEDRPDDAVPLYRLTKDPT
jgi:hypothetical protein